LINDEKSKEIPPTGPIYPPIGGGGSKTPSGQGGGKPGGTGGDGKGDEEGKKPPTGGSKGEEIVQQEGLQVITSDVVNEIINEISTTTTTTTEEEKNTNIDRAKQILKKVDQALRKKAYDDKNSKTIEDLLEKLKQNQSEQVVVQSATLGRQVKDAIKHLEELKKQTSLTQSQSPEKN